MSLFARLMSSLVMLLVSAHSAQAVDLRVLITSAKTIKVKVPQAKGLATDAAQYSEWEVGLGTLALTLNGQEAQSPLYLPPSQGSVVYIEGRAYRGGLLLRRQDDQVQAINVLDLEDYLRGVVPSEMPSSWPAAALAAQAVVARSYAAARISPQEPYDTCADESCQVYGGLDAEQPQTDQAILRTAGQVVAYDGRPAMTYFSSDSGGHTASSLEVWGMNLPYLAAQADPFSLSALGPRNTWKLEVPLSTVQSVAERYGVRGTIQSLKVSKRTSSGRPEQLTISTPAGTFQVSGVEAGAFIRSLGAGSSRVTLSGLSPLILIGQGQGHGVGLSQYGALGMARRDYSYLHILGFYYPGTVLTTLAGTQAAPGR